MVLSDMVHGCVRGCVEELWYNIFLFHVLIWKGGGWGVEGRKYLN